jgi:hypothetical protein
MSVTGRGGSLMKKETNWSVTIPSILMMEAACSSKMFRNIFQTTSCHYSEDHNLSFHCNENLMSTTDSK